MNDPNMQNYRTLMEDVKTPDSVTEGIRSKTKALRSEERDCVQQQETTTSASSARNYLPRKNHVAVRFAAAACFVALVGGGALLFSDLPFSAELEESGPSLTSPESENFFTLVAYADENTERAPGEAVLLDLGETYAGSAGTMADPSVSETELLANGEWADDWGYVDYNLNLTCSGENITTIRYEIVGEGAVFGGMVNGDPEENNDPGPEEASSFTVEYDSQEADKDYLSRYIAVEFPLSEEMLSLYEAWRQSNSEKDDKQFWCSLYNQGAHTLEQVTLRLTATFTDGSTQVKDFRIAPVEDFESKLLEGYQDTDLGETLFTLTEVQ